MSFEASLQRIRNQGFKKTKNFSTVYRQANNELWNNTNFHLYQKQRRKHLEEKQEKIQRPRTPQNLNPVTGTKLTDFSPRETRSDGALLSQRGDILDDDLHAIISSQKSRIVGIRNSHNPSSRKNHKRHHTWNDASDGVQRAASGLPKQSPLRLIPMAKKDRVKIMEPNSPESAENRDLFERQSSGLYKTSRKLPRVSEQIPEEGICLESHRAFVPYSDNDTGVLGEFHHGEQYCVPMSTPIHWSNNLSAKSHSSRGGVLCGTLEVDKEDPKKASIVLKLRHRQDAALSDAKILSEEHTYLNDNNQEDMTRDHCAFCDNPLFQPTYCPLKHVIHDGQVEEGVKEERNPHIILSTSGPPIPETDVMSLRKVLRQNQLREKEVKNLLDDIQEISEWNQELLGK